MASDPPEQPKENTPPNVAQTQAAVQAALLAQLSQQRASLPYLGGPILGPLPPGFVVPIQPQTAISAQQTVQLWQGEYPPPEAMKTYEALMPGAFDRMMKMSEQRLTAQIDETKRAQEFIQRDTRRSHWLGAATHTLAVTSALICTALGARYGLSGAFWVAGALVSVPVMAVGRSFVESVKQPSTTEVLRATALPLEKTQPSAPLPPPPKAQ